jgi:hypothetical protein
MPPAIIAALIGAAVTGTTTGLEASGAIGGGGGPSLSQAEQQQQQQQVQNNKQLTAQEQQAFKQFAPDAQAATGGSLSDQSFSALVSELAGQPGDIQLAQQTIFPSTSSSGLSG